MLELAHNVLLKQKESGDNSPLNRIDYFDFELFEKILTEATEFRSKAIELKKQSIELMKRSKELMGIGKGRRKEKGNK
ncbi:MAG: hypothetical protein H8E57_10240 [Candidatus Cloacimonetes bacterium]|nr:hypothetical protein [Candidatus Cloacimonadota bacterium]